MLISFLYDVCICVCAANNSRLGIIEFSLTLWRYPIALIKHSRVDLVRFNRSCFADFLGTYNNFTVPPMERENSVQLKVLGFLCWECFPRIRYSVCVIRKHIVHLSCSNVDITPIYLEVILHYENCTIHRK